MYQCHYSTYGKRKLIAHGDIEQNPQHRQQKRFDRSNRDFRANRSTDGLQTKTMQPGIRIGLKQKLLNRFTLPFRNNNTQSFRTAGQRFLIAYAAFFYNRFHRRTQLFLGYFLLKRE